MESTEGLTAQETVKKEQAKVAMDLLNGMADLQDTLTLVVEGMGGLESGECVAFGYMNDALMSFLDSNPNFKTASPRSIRDEDRKKILPGQHAGVYLQFDLQDGTTLKMNFWGGLRTPSGQDLKDGDVTLSRSHTRRTEEVLGQVTHLNWQIRFPDESKIDSWIAFNPDNNGSFQQSDLIINGDRIDCHPNISNEDSRFQQLKKGVLSPVDGLVRLVPTSV